MNVENPLLDGCHKRRPIHMPLQRIKLLWSNSSPVTLIT